MFVKKGEQKKAVWVDLLCWGAAFRIMRYARRCPIATIQYINVARSFKSFIPWLERSTGVPCIAVNNMVEAELKIDGMSVYEMVQNRILAALDLWVDQQKLRHFSESFCFRHQYNTDKFYSHLREAAYPHLFRAVEMSVLGECLNGKDRCVFVMRRTPFKRLLKFFLGPEQTLFYRTLASGADIEVRKNYYYDAHLNETYFNNRVFTLGHFFLIWLFNSISALSNNRGNVAAKLLDPTIGVELSQSRQRVDTINDLAWLDGAGIASKHVCAFEFTNYDEESIALLHSYGIRRYKVLEFPSQLIKRLAAIGRDPDVTSLTAQWWFGIRTCGAIGGLLRSVLAWNESAWLRFQASKYFCRTTFWQSIYGQLGVRVLWTMFDIDEDKLAKAQAVELLGGLSASGHWSNFPMYHVDNEKACDVILAWGDHFIKNNFQHFSYMAIFLVGYPCDFYFKARQSGAEAIRQRHEGKFILSYHDNIMANDLPYSKSMQLEIHSMLLSILRKFEDVVVLLKPKRRFVIDEIFAELPELAHYLREGRLEVFLGDTPRTKAVPAQIAMASDLVIGLGISTTAAESFFAGTVAFHADFTGFKRNEFSNRGNGVIVFRDIFTLEKAVIDRITQKNKMSLDEYRAYYTCLDPFQDGCAAKRTGFILKRIREYLSQGMDRQALLEKVKRDYDVYLSSMDKLFGMNLN